MSEPRLSVCPECVENSYFTGFIQEHADSLVCSCCGREGEEPIALSTERIAERVQEGIEFEWGEAARENVPVEGGEYVFGTYQTLEVLSAVQFYAGCEEVHRDIAARLPDRAWVRKDPFSLPEDENLRIGWKTFSTLTKHRNRYLFFPNEGRKENYVQVEGVTPERMLARVGELIARLDLLTSMEEGSQVFRVRIHEPGNQPEGEEQLGPPPVDRAVFSNRMSPAGISMFYASLDEETALTETYQRREDSPAEATIGTFRLRQDLELVSFVDIPDVPSLFANRERRWQRRPLLFLHDFIDDLTKPIKKDRRQHIDYVPSQIVTEYLRFRLDAHVGSNPDGILYPSAATEEGVSCVLFFSHPSWREEIHGLTPAEYPVELVGTKSRRL